MENKHQWFCQSVEREKTGLYRLAVSILHNDEDAKDAVAEALCRAYAKLDTLHDLEKFHPWILQIVARESYTLLRRRGKIIYLDELRGAEEPSAPAQYHEEGALWQAVQSLGDDMRAVVVLFYYEDLSIREISTVTGVTEGTVRTRLTRARHKLKQILTEKGGVVDGTF